MKIPEDSRVWIGGGVAAAVLVSVLGWIFLFGPKLSHTHSLRDQADSARITNDGLSTELTRLKADQEKLAEYTSMLRHVRDALPITDALPAFTESASGHAHDVSVNLKSMTVGTITPVSESGEAITSSPAANGAVPATAGHLFAIPVSIVSTGAFDAQLKFLAELQKVGPRVALVTGTRFTPGDDTKDESVDKNCSMTTNVSIFVAPKTPQEAEQLQKQLAGLH
jgi:hypothetical protein